MVIWQGVGDLINDFRRFELGLEQLDVMRAPSLIHRLHIPFTYLCVFKRSPSFLHKPDDWHDHINIAGFNFLSANKGYTPPPDLVEFLEAGPPPIYIGFGSIVVDDPDALTQTILDAVGMTGQRALISKGWGGFGADQINRSDVYFLGSVPHDWLFQRVSCVIHHGGAGTTATGLAFGRPTTIVPFFGDQPFWGTLVALNGAGPSPIPIKKLTAELLADAIHFCLKPSAVEKAQRLSENIRAEDGARTGLESFHRHLQQDLRLIQCSLCPDRPAVWRVRRTKIILSTFAATVLVQGNKLDPKDVKLYRTKRYTLEHGCAATDTFTGAMSNFITGLVDFPVNVVQNIAQPASDRFAENYNLYSCEDRSAAIRTPAVTVMDSASPRISSQGEGTQNNDDTKSILSLSSAFTTQSQVDAPSMNIRRSPLQSIATNTAYTGRRVANWVIEVPMGVTVLLSQTFHHGPRWYHDRTVRETPEVDGEFGYSFYDGIIGIVTQPMQGWRDEGFGGMAKGIGMWGLLGYPLNGIHRGIERSYGAKRKNYIVHSRIRQGLAESESASQEERDSVLEKWRAYEKGVGIKHEKQPR
ncbi:hypothetical protein EYZ11_008837 [Aspergillus tanneri]|uniref:Erythromycin biosynthesis protein CIII-like C-terminal domain-containing protein n=1 Tax=Aspergillus tanneri TaxID=1220188 RepID=A0A4S3J9R6_9EURO|nr:hypothetical protein EYZ11_008837 [Aspergillus tanneri]